MDSIFNREPRPCIMAQLKCSNCGPVRMALAPQEEPLTTLECPYCFGAAKAKFLSAALTVRNLPYFEREENLRDDVTAIDAALAKTEDRQQLERGQLVIYCEEEHVLHLARVGEVHTSAVHLSSTGFPSISFRIGENETIPVPHISTRPSSPPWWCFSNELPTQNAPVTVAVTAPVSAMVPAPVTAPVTVAVTANDGVKPRRGRRKKSLTAQ